MPSNENAGSTPAELPYGAGASLSLATRSVHADDRISGSRDVAPAIHVSTTFRYSDDPDQLQPPENYNANAPRDSHIYSRESNSNTTRFEAVLTSVLGGPSVTYSSGLSAFHAMLVHLNPKRIVIGDGYHGCHGVIRILTRITGLKQLSLDFDPAELEAGDVVHIETPLNPTGEARDLQYYADIAHAAGAYLSVDATFAPPPLLDPFAFGADIVLHSGTKYIGGHSDMLCGVLAVNPKHVDWLDRLLGDRVYLGSVMGSLEGWLGLRSVRSLELRVKRQSETATALVQWLSSQLKDSSSAVSAVVDKVLHASLQPEASVEGSWLRKQMPSGYGPVFAILMKETELAKRLPSKLHLFHHATSLGGAESLIEWRRMSDNTVDPRLLRVSIGIEGFEDLKEELHNAFEELKKEKNSA